jgi:hypothetical protein
MELLEECRTMKKRCTNWRLAPLFALLVVAGAARAATDTATLITDLTQFYVDGDKAAADAALTAADRLVIATDVNTNSSTLKPDVIQFFHDFDATNNQEHKRITERHELYFDLGRTPIKFTKPTNASKDLATEVKQLFVDIDARTQAEQNVDNDLTNWRVSLTTNDTAGLTSNGNKFFDDRHTLNQDRINVNFDCAVLRGITKDKAVKPVIPKLDKTMDLKTAAKNFTTARANFDTAGVTLDTARDALRAAQGTSSLESATTAFLDARHNRNVTSQLLGAARHQMRFSAGLIKTPKEPGTTLPKPPKPPAGKKPAPKGENEGADNSSNSGEVGNDPDA